MTFPLFTADMSVVELTAIYNGLTDKPIKKFETKAKALARLDALKSLIGLGLIIPTTKVVEVAPAKKTRVTRKVSISSVVITNHEAGKSMDDITTTIMAEFPNAVFANNAKKAKAHVAWYISKAKQQASNLAKQAKV